MATEEKYVRQLEELQSQLAFQEDMLRALNEAVATQQRDILVLRRQVELLNQRQDEQEQRLDDGEGPAQKPPHY